NRLNTIHGGTLASLVDLGGSLAVASTGRYATGVSTDLNVTYLAPGGRPGDVLRGVATCDKIGKTLAYTTVTFTNSKGQLAARGSHTKYVSAAPLKTANVRCSPESLATSSAASEAMASQEPNNAGGDFVPGYVDPTGSWDARILQ
ncbi:hypothetical protein E4U42_001481, partial [Claviceps africana]